MRSVKAYGYKLSWNWWYFYYFGLS